MGTLLNFCSKVYKQGLEKHKIRPLYSTDPALIYRNMAVSYLRIGDKQGALDSYQACLKYRPNHEYCQQMVASLREQIGVPADDKRPEGFDVRHLNAGSDV